MGDYTIKEGREKGGGKRGREEGERMEGGREEICHIWMYKHAGMSNNLTLVK